MSPIQAEASGLEAEAVYLDGVIGPINLYNYRGKYLGRPSVAPRATFLIDQKGVVGSAIINDLPLGRNIGETLRLLDALQQVEQHGEVCPVNWQVGKEMMKAPPESLKVHAQTHLVRS